MFQFLFIDRPNHNKIYDLMKSCCIQERITTPLTRCRQVEQHHLYPAPFSSRQDGRGAWHGGHTMLEAAQVAHNLSFIPFLLIACERDERSVVCTVHAVPAWELS
jgi:hypothetical protein